MNSTIYPKICRSSFSIAAISLILTAGFSQELKNPPHKNPPGLVKDRLNPGTTFRGVNANEARSVAAYFEANRGTLDVVNLAALQKGAEMNAFPIKFSKDMKSATLYTRSARGQLVQPVEARIAMIDTKRLMELFASLRDRKYMIQCNLVDHPATLGPVKKEIGGFDGDPKNPKHVTFRDVSRHFTRLEGTGEHEGEMTVQAIGGVYQYSDDKGTVFADQVLNQNGFVLTAAEWPKH